MWAEKDFSDKANEEMRLYNLTMKVNRLELLKAKIGLELVSGFDELEKLLGEKLTKRHWRSWKDRPESLENPYRTMLKRHMLL